MFELFHDASYCFADLQFPFHVLNFPPYVGHLLAVRF
jgi:hypothetical protein